MLVTHNYIKDLYFKYKKEGEIDISEEEKEAIIDYIETIKEFKEKRNWDGVEDMDSHAEMFVKRMLGEEHI